MRSDSSIRKIGTEKNDSKILALVSRELVSSEACYHRKCYRSYTTPEARSSVNPDMSSASSDDEYARLESDAGADPHRLPAFYGNRSDFS